MRIRLWFIIVLSIVLAAAVWGYSKYRALMSYNETLLRAYQWQHAQQRGVLIYLHLTNSPTEAALDAAVSRVNRMVGPQLRLDSALDQTLLQFPVFPSQVPPLVLNPRMTCRGPLDDRFDANTATQHGSIILCRETAQLAFDLAWRAPPQYAALRFAQVSRFLEFVLAHELAHGLMDKLHVAFTGPPEESADELGAMLLVESDDFGRFELDQVTSFLAALGQLASVSAEIRSAHGMSAQRAERIRCIGIGYQSYRRQADSTMTQPEDGLAWGATDEQVRRCSSDYGPLRERWKAALRGYWLGRDGAAFEATLWR